MHAFIARNVTRGCENQVPICQQQAWISVISFMENFSGDRLLRLPEVERKVGLKKSEIYRRMGIEAFPRSRSLGPRCVVWLESEIEEWVRSIARQKT